MPRFARTSQRRFGAALALEQLESRRPLSVNPTPFEQALLEDINRLRADPAGELAVIFSSLDPLAAHDSDVQRAIDFFHVNGDVLLDQWSQLRPADPLAWNEILMQTAVSHSELMVQQDLQRHQLPGEASLGQRVTDAGYDYQLVTENIYAFAESHLHTHAGFVIDWGDTDTGIQQPPGHRDNIFNDELIDVGISVVADSDPTTSVGPYLVTQDFGQPFRFQTPFLLGVAWTDLDENGIYDPGEGLSDVAVTISGGGQTYQTSTMDAGGYQLRVPPGTYRLTASGGAIDGVIVADTIVVGGNNVKVDFVAALPKPPLAVADAFQLTQGGPAELDVLTNDSASFVQLDAGSVVVTQSPTGGTAAVLAEGIIQYTPYADFVGTDTLRYTVRDTVGTSSNVAAVTIEVSGAGITAVPDSAITQAGQPVTIDVLVNDVISNGAVVDVSIAAEPGSGTAELVGNSIRYTSFSNYVGETTFQYRVETAAGASAVASVSVVVADPARPWQNPVWRLDVNGDGHVSPIDALLVINNLGLALSSPAGSDVPPPWIDVTGDNAISPVDALLVVNQLNNNPSATSSTTVSRTPSDDFDEDDQPTAWDGVLFAIALGR